MSARSHGDAGKLSRYRLRCHRDHLAAPGEWALAEAISAWHDARPVLLQTLR